MKKANKKGFTLIEVVLVLAIGGLIFLLAFLAFQNASKNRRDTQRREDASKVLAEIANAEGDGFKLSSTNVGTFNSTYISGIKGPNGAYAVAYGLPAGGPSTTVENIYVSANSICNNNNAFTTKTGNNAVIVTLEKGTACRDDE